MSDTTPFDPSAHLMKVSGNDYLEVKWRIAWFRDKHPDGRIETEMLAGDETFALFKATVWVPNDGGSATGHGSETPRDFKDHYEKSETKAIGRALAALGFGTQFCPDHEFGAATGRVVDAPVGRSQEPTRLPIPRNQSQSPESDPQAATERQIKYLHVVARDAGMSPSQLDDYITKQPGMNPSALTKSDASNLIARLQNAQPAVAP